jgi:hypothetical protein
MLRALLLSAKTQMSQTRKKEVAILEEISRSFRKHVERKMNRVYVHISQIKI